MDNMDETRELIGQLDAIFTGHAPAAISMACVFILACLISNARDAAGSQDVLRGIVEMLERAAADWGK